MRLLVLKVCVKIMCCGCSSLIESRTRLVECPSFKGKVFGSNPNVFKLVFS